MTGDSMNTGQTGPAKASPQESNPIEDHHPKASMSAPSSAPKYRKVYEDLLSAIRTGAFQPGDRLPSEAELGKQYDTSRITVAKAVNELQQKGLVSRRPGSGTRVIAPTASSGRVFGLLIPDLGRTEILDRKSTRLNSSHLARSRMPSSA